MVTEKSLEKKWLIKKGKKKKIFPIFFGHETGSKHIIFLDLRLKLENSKELEGTYLILSVIYVLHVLFLRTCILYFIYVFFLHCFYAMTSQRHEYVHYNP